LRRQIPVRLDRNTLTDMRIAVIPQRWPARRGNMRWLRVDTDVIEDPPDLRALGDKGDQAHLPTAHWAQQREDFVERLLKSSFGKVYNQYSIGDPNPD
jgi:hypothetical protein